MTVLAYLVFLAQAVDPPPAGFKEVDECWLRTILWQQHDDSGLFEPSYKVSRDEGVFRVETWVEAANRWRASKPKFKGPGGSIAVPFKDRRPIWDGSGIAVSDGWISGTDNGEWGGGLAHLGRDKKSYRILNLRNTPLVFETKDGIFAVQELCHLGIEYSDLIKISKSPDGWKTEVVTNLHTCLRGLVFDRDRVVFATDEYVSTLETTGQQFELLRFRDQIPVRSLVVEPNGKIWFSYELGVAKMVPITRRNYRTHWYIPKGLPPAKRK